MADRESNETTPEDGEERTRGARIRPAGFFRALVVAAAKAGLLRAELTKALPRVAEIPFDSDRKRMTTIHRHDPAAAGTATPAGFSFPPLFAFVKGGPDVVLDRCGHILQDGQAVPLMEEKRREVLERNREMAGNALRLLAVAYRPLEAVPESPDPDQVEKDLTFIGLLGMIDPPREEATAAVARAKGAGIRPLARLPACSWSASIPR